jgi:hypothetical protein
MPLARINVEGKDANYRHEVSRVVYEAMVSIGAPANDRFQVIAEHDAENFVYDPNYVGIARSDELYPPEHLERRSGRPNRKSNCSSRSQKDSRRRSASGSKIFSSRSWMLAEKLVVRERHRAIRHLTCFFSHSQQRLFTTFHSQRRAREKQSPACRNGGRRRRAKRRSARSHDPSR